MTTGYASYLSPIHFRLSADAVGRAQEPKFDVLVAVMFAATGLEAFLNDLRAICEYLPSHAQPSPVADLAVELALAEARRGSALTRIDSVARILQLDIGVGSVHREALEVLFAYRNNVAHLRPDRYSWEAGEEPFDPPEHPVLKGLINQNVLPAGSTARSRNWIFDATQPAVARWAYGTAASTLHIICAAVPPCTSGLMARFLAKQVAATQGDT